MAVIYTHIGPRVKAPSVSWIFQNLPSAEVGQIINVNLSEQQDFADLRRLLQERFPIDTDLISDGMSMSSNRFVTDRQDVADIRSMNFRLETGERCDIVDGVLKALNLAISDNQVGSDLVAKVLRLFRGEQQDATDASAETFIKALIDVLAILDSVEVTRVIAMSLADTEDVADGMRKLLTLGMPDTQVETDAIASIFSRLLAPERQDISDSMSFNRVASVSASDTLAVSDVAQKLFLLNRGESQDVSDSTARTLLKFLTESQSVSDTVQALKFISIMLSETQDVVDGLRKSFEMNRIDDQALADVSRKIFEKYLSADNEVASDTSTFVRLVSLILSDREDIADGIRKLFALQPSESAATSDATTNLFVKALAESQSVSDVSALHEVLGIGLSDSFVVEDILAKVFFKNISDREDVEETLRKIIYATLLDVRQDVSDTVSAVLSGVAAIFIEYAVSSVIDTMQRTAGNIDAVRRRETIADSLRRIVGEKIGKRK